MLSCLHLSLYTDEVPSDLILWQDSILQNGPRELVSLYGPFGVKMMVEVLSYCRAVHQVEGMQTTEELMAHGSHVMRGLYNLLQVGVVRLQNDISLKEGGRRVYEVTQRKFVVL